jgi:hypothetical protein
MKFLITKIQIDCNLFPTYQLDRQVVIVNARHDCFRRHGNLAGHVVDE